MTLLIAYLLMVQMGADPLAYPAVAVLWFFHLGYHNR